MSRSLRVVPEETPVIDVREEAVLTPELEREPELETRNAQRRKVFAFGPPRLCGGGRGGSTVPSAAPPLGRSVAMRRGDYDKWSVRIVHTEDGEKEVFCPDSP